MGKLKEWLGALKGKISWIVSILIAVSAVITEIETGVVRNTAAEARAWWNAPAQNVSSDVIVDVLYASVSMRCSHAEPPEGIGSGILLHKWGRTYVITAAHVVRCEVKGTNFTMYAYQGTNTWKLKLVNVSVGHDLALLRVESPGLVGRSIRWFDPLGVPPLVGTRVIHIGNLFGDMSHSFSEGLVSRIGVSPSIDPDMDYDQSTAVVYSGSSGGGMFTLDGRCIGIVTLSRGPQVNLFVPVRRIHLWARENDLLWLFE